MVQDSTSNWEREFDKKFVVYTGTKRIGRVGYFTTPHDDFAVGHDPKLIKSFIHSLLSQQRAELIEKVKVNKLMSIAKYGNMPVPHDPTYKEAYNQALDDVLQLLKGEIK